MTLIRNSSQLRLASIVIFPLLISCLGFAIAYLDIFKEFRKHVSGASIPSELVSSGRTAKELRLLEYRSLANVDLEGFDKYLDADEMPSTKVLEQEAKDSGLPILSLSIDPDYLYGTNAGLIPNSSKKGRNWERPAYFSYFENGKLRIASGAGLRVHGGKTRAASIKSFRLHFRELYGRADVPSDIFFDGNGSALKSVVIHADLRNTKDGQSSRPWHFMNPIAYELARELECITPDTKVVKYYINGVYQGPYVLTEHISPSFLNRRFGHDNFVLARLKWEWGRPGESGLVQGNPQLLEDYRSWASTVPAPLSMDAVAAVMDLDGLTNWIISVVYVGATDQFQGAVILDETDPNARWRFVNWDMDHGFRDVYNQVPLDWEIDNFTGTSGIFRSKNRRAIVFNRLRQESPEYRKRFLARFVEVLNHVLTVEKVRAIIENYKIIATQFEMDDTFFLQKMEEFAEFRPAILREQLDQYFDAGAAYRLTIANDSGASITVDGYPIGANYSGWCFSETPVSIRRSLTTESTTQTLNIDGHISQLNDREVTISLTRDTEITIH
jgi:hypothetical protein